MVDQDGELHPAFPFFCLVAGEEGLSWVGTDGVRLAGSADREETCQEGERAEDGEVGGDEVFAHFGEELRAVAHEAVYGCCENGCAGRRGRVRFMAE